MEPQGQRPNVTRSAAGAGLSVAVAVGSFAAQTASLITADQARVLLIISAFVFVICAVVLFYHWWNDRQRNSLSPPAQQATSAEHEHARPNTLIHYVHPLLDCLN